jgi:uncharacterized membrane protein
VKLTTAIAFMLAGIGIGYLISTVSLRPQTLTYSELASVSLTAAAVAVGCVALIVTVAAVFGFQTIKNESVEKAKKEAVAVLQQKLDKEVEEAINERLEQRVDTKIRQRLEPEIEKMLENAGDGGKFDNAVAKAIYPNHSEELDREFDDGDIEER